MFDLSKNAFYLNGAIGPKGGGDLELAEHKDRGVTGKQVFLGQYSQFVPPEVQTYLGCGDVSPVKGP